MKDRQPERAAMVEQQLRARGIRDPRVLAAMQYVPRHLFVPSEFQAAAYEDKALPIEAGQTISQPYIVARMAEALALQPGDRLLEIGTGSGYAAAVFAQLVAAVYTVERHRPLAAMASERFDRLELHNIWVGVGDGSQGWPRYAPYDAISVPAAGPGIAGGLRGQLIGGGRMVMPIGARDEQQLVLLERTAIGERTIDLGPVRFVPLVGQGGWEPNEP